MKRKAHKRYAFLLYDSIPVHQDIRRFINESNAKGEPTQRVIVNALADYLIAQGVLPPPSPVHPQIKQVSAPATHTAHVPLVVAAPDMEALQAEQKKKREEAAKRFLTAKF